MCAQSTPSATSCWTGTSSGAVTVASGATLAGRGTLSAATTVNGTLAPGVRSKDVALAIIGRTGTAGGTGYVIEYAGDDDGTDPRERPAQSRHADSR